MTVDDFLEEEDIEDLQEQEVLCNFCGYTCAFPNTNSNQPYGLIKKSVNGGYHSTPGNGNGALDDVTFYTFSLCEFCLDYLFRKFQIPPLIGTYVGSEDYEVFRPATQRIKEDSWRKHDPKWQLEYDARAAARQRKV
jgi:hypothetical protein